MVVKVHSGLLDFLRILPARSGFLQAAPAVPDHLDFLRIAPADCLLLTDSGYPDFDLPVPDHPADPGFPVAVQQVSPRAW